MGYFVYRMYSRRGYRTTALLARLERGAWEILLRYERFLHEVKLGPQKAKDTIGNRRRKTPSEKDRKSEPTVMEKTRQRKRLKKLRKSITKLKLT